MLAASVLMNVLIRSDCIECDEIDMVEKKYLCVCYCFFFFFKQKTAYEILA